MKMSAIWWHTHLSGEGITPRRNRLILDTGLHHAPNEVGDLVVDLASNEIHLCIVYDL